MKTACLVSRQGCKYRYILFFSKSKYPLDLPASVLALPSGHRAVGNHQPLPFPFRAPNNASSPACPADRSGQITYYSII
jgi:hypothetical protein